MSELEFTVYDYGSWVRIRSNNPIFAYFTIHESEYCVEFRRGDIDSLGAKEIAPKGGHYVFAYPAESKYRHLLPNGLGKFDAEDSDEDSTFFFHKDPP